VPGRAPVYRGQADERLRLAHGGASLAGPRQGLAVVAGRRLGVAEGQLVSTVEKMNIFTIPLFSGAHNLQVDPGRRIAYGFGPGSSSCSRWH
jgi:hypothetical protein